MAEQHIDKIEPIQIEHSIDEVWEGDQLHESYNFLDYHFEREGNYCRARTYADDFQSISLFGPFEGRHSIQRIDSPNFEHDVTLYLERRFIQVSRR
ncbi:hypothetical protein ATE68_04295 [Sphingopyxis sp. H038]|uniref:hypothetical protein n=1 Tax=unclassified Sphingopyxis TaxID=2614943 RepID=UPI000730D101|nr:MULTISPECIES: hypothetical protein [unclassified Sphingopyxis]KTE03113.1 hypothetical protein ATE78_07370 [Sphingopyxis sp. H012]KTE10491.1 hypothetical protein ATE70_11615 [Sphingopyxis sp. H053]KTE14584.1 hypothetical protein ATE76_07190 [Sphingopyxis sp. H093]KTE28726.1 hypothetical protein ATE75_11270 [Sphingopyxis sp. H080]KTE36095.1 hypothetical protein ATE68_04295 [Sphingopyxis sp. H038]